MVFPPLSFGPLLALRPFLFSLLTEKLQVTDLRPPSARLNLTDVSEITKWEMPVEQYEKRSDSVRAWKERNQLGRFDPSKQSQSEAGKAAAHEKLWREAKARGIEVGKRCRVGGEDGRRGTVRYVGEVDEIPAGGIWVGVEGDEPTGRGTCSFRSLPVKTAGFFVRT